MIQGSLVAIVTPMHQNGAVDYDSLDKLIAWHIAKGTDGLVVLGTTGESVTITQQERTQIIRTAIAAVAGRIPVIVGTGTNSTAMTIESTRQALAEGADAALLVTPYYNKPTQEGLYQHYKAVAKAVAIPQILYNVPGRTACDLLPETVLRLSASCSNIIGVKEASGDVQRLSRLLSLQTGLQFYSGDDSTAKDFILAGGDGVISVAANIVPDKIHAMVMAALSGNAQLANQIDQSLRDLYSALFVESNPIPAKWLLSKIGLIETGIRLPLTHLGINHHARVADAYSILGS